MGIASNNLPAPLLYAQCIHRYSLLTQNFIYNFNYFISSYLLSWSQDRYQQYLLLSLSYCPCVKCYIFRELKVILSYSCFVLCNSIFLLLGLKNKEPRDYICNRTGIKKNYYLLYLPIMTLFDLRRDLIFTDYNLICRSPPLLLISNHEVFCFVPLDNNDSNSMYIIMADHTKSFLLFLYVGVNICKYRLLVPASVGEERGGKTMSNVI
jgi:hypothetical protein